MFFRMPRFIRRFIRRHTSPIPAESAISYRKILSVVYAVAAWNLFGFCIAKYIKLKRDITPEDRAKAAAQPPWWVGKVYNLDDKTTYYRVEGFSIKKIDKTTEETKETPEVDGLSESSFAQPETI